MEAVESALVLNDDEKEVIFGRSYCLLISHELSETQPPAVKANFSFLHRASKPHRS